MNFQQPLLQSSVSHRSLQIFVFLYADLEYALWLSTLKTSRVTRVTLVLWIGNETLRWTHRERPLRDRCLNPYRITPIHWLMARRRLWRNHVVSSYWRTRHPLLRFLCRKEPCRQREELGSECSVSFPIQRTRVTRVTRDALFHRWTQRCVERIGNDIPNTPSWSAAYLVQWWTNNIRSVQTDKTWEPGAVSTSRL